MKIKILGTVSPYPKQEHNCPGFLVESNNHKILLDCGNGITRLMNFPNDLNNLVVIISHLHKDHYGDLTSLAYASYCYHNLGLLNNKTDVYLPEPNSSDEEVIYNYLISGREHYLNYKCYNRYTNININNMYISFNQNYHDITTYSCKIIDNERTLVYSSDTGYNHKFIDFCKGIDALICESTFLRNQQKDNDNHLCAYQAGLIAKYANINHLSLTHFWPEIDRRLYIEEAKEVFENVSACQENKVLKLGGLL